MIRISVQLDRLIYTWDNENQTIHVTTYPETDPEEERRVEDHIAIPVDPETHNKMVRALHAAISEVNSE